MPESYSERAVVWLSTNPAATWFIRHVASRIDPILFRATNGRLTTFGPPLVPMLTLVTTGRRTGKPRPVHLVSVPFQGHPHVVASAMGQERHPAWRYNLEAQPEVGVQAAGDRYRARAEPLDEREKQAIWATLREAIPQLRVYETRTDRDIRVFRIRRI